MRRQMREKRMFSKTAFVVAACLLGSFAIGCNRDDDDSNPSPIPASAPVDINGSWQGTTSNGHRIEFSVNQNALASIEYLFHSCGGSLNLHQYSINPAAPVVDRSV